MWRRTVHWRWYPVQPSRSIDTRSSAALPCQHMVRYLRNLSGRNRNELINPLMKSLVIKTGDGVLDHVLKVSQANYQQVIKTLAADRA